MRNSESTHAEKFVCVDDSAADDWDDLRAYNFPAGYPGPAPGLHVVNQPYDYKCMWGHFRSTYLKVRGNYNDASLYETDALYYRGSCEAGMVCLLGAGPKGEDGCCDILLDEHSRNNWASLKTSAYISDGDWGKRSRLCFYE